jgi:hypothetical protein
MNERYIAESMFRRRQQRMQEAATVIAPYNDGTGKTYLDRLKKDGTITVPQEHASGFSSFLKGEDIDFDTKANDTQTIFTIKKES